MSMTRYELDIEGRRAWAHAEWVGGTLWVHLDGRCFSVALPEASSQKKSRGGSGGSGGDLLAPMPGKVTKVFCKTGDLLEKGAAVLVMEAMKMEYTLKADQASTVIELCCAVNDQVTLGKTLVKLAPTDKGAVE